MQHCSLPPSRSAEFTAAPSTLSPLAGREAAVRQTRCRWLAASALALALGSAHAGRPLQTDDAGVLDRGACEVEAAAERVRLEGERARGTSLALGCGAGSGVQLGLGVSRVSAGGARETGAEFGGKWALWRGSGAEDAPALALGWGVAGARDAAGTWRHVATDLVLLASVPLQSGWTLHANLGHARDETQPGQRSTTWGLALEHAGWALPGGVGVAPMAEVFGDDRERPWWNVGLRLTLLPDRLWADVAVARQQQSGGARAVGLGLKLAF